MIPREFHADLAKEVGPLVKPVRMVPGQCRMNAWFGVPASNAEGWDGQTAHFNLELDLWPTSDYPRWSADRLSESLRGTSSIGWEEARVLLLSELRRKLPDWTRRVEEDELYRMRVGWGVELVQAYSEVAAGVWHKLPVGLKGVAVEHKPGRIRVRFENALELWVATHYFTGRSYAPFDRVTGQRVPHGTGGAEEREIEDPTYRWVEPTPDPPSVT